MTALVVLAKSPQAGRSKTRLCPPCSPAEAAQVAEAALRDTLDAALTAAATRRVLVLDGPPVHQLDPSFEVIPQRGGGFGERLAAAFADVGEAMVLIGMDTPQVSTGLLDRAVQQVELGVPVLGPARDGGWWALGLPSCPAGAFDGVPMSTSTTCVHQRARLQACGIEPEPLPTLRDVDHWTDALAVAERAPDGRFARTVDGIEQALRVAS
jgi:rSAM/selenodomain-associated transferase 1